MGLSRVLASVLASHISAATTYACLMLISSLEHTHAFCLPRDQALSSETAVLVLVDAGQPHGIQSLLHRSFHHLSNFFIFSPLVLLFDILSARLPWRDRSTARSVITNSPLWLFPLVDFSFGSLHTFINLYVCENICILTPITRNTSLNSSPAAFAFTNNRLAAHPYILPDKSSSGSYRLWYLPLTQIVRWWAWLHRSDHPGFLAWLRPRPVGSVPIYFLLLYISPDWWHLPSRAFHRLRSAALDFRALVIAGLPRLVYSFL